MFEEQLIRVLISEAEIKARIQVLVDQINQDYQDSPVTALCVLKGAFVFFSDLIRFIRFPMTCEFLRLNFLPSHHHLLIDQTSLRMDHFESLKGRHVIVFDDFMETGRTIQSVLGWLETQKPASIKTCVLLLNTKCCLIDYRPDYLGFQVSFQNIVGYGLDTLEHYRSLPYIGCWDSV